MFWLMIGCFVIAGMLFITTNKDNNRLKEQGVLYRDLFATFIGGFPDIEGGKSAILYVRKEHIRIDIGSIMRTISINDLINAEIKSEQQIQNEISLGKIILFGFLAWGLKNKKTNVNNYLVLTYKDNSEQRNLVFQSDNLEELTKQIRSVKFNN